MRIRPNYNEGCKCNRCRVELASKGRGSHITLYRVVSDYGLSVYNSLGYKYYSCNIEVPLCKKCSNAHPVYNSIVTIIELLLTAFLIWKLNIFNGDFDWTMILFSILCLVASVIAITIITFPINAFIEKNDQEFHYYPDSSYRPVQILKMDGWSEEKPKKIHIAGDPEYNSYNETKLRSTLQYIRNQCSCTIED